MTEPTEDKNAGVAAPADDQLKRRLLGRMAVAGGIVVVLLVGLMIVDQSGRPQPEIPPVAHISPAPPEAPAADAGATADKPAEETVVADKGNAVSDSDTTAAPPLDASAKPLTAPAEARPASLRPSPPAVVARGTEPAQSVPARPPVAVAPHAPASHPLSQPAGVPVQSAQVAEAPGTSRQFVVQMGVFNNVANAEELRAKLELAGIPAQIEARVKVGPFATREDAEAARKKLASLGLDPGYLTATRK
jgi:DedD protein